MKIVDLHVHSNKSDGSLTPTELVKLAADKGLSAIALTDHDTVDGLDEAMNASRSLAADQSLEVVPGIELSTEYENKDIHILGLFLDYHDLEFNNKIQDFIDSRNIRNEKMCTKLQDAGIDISYDKLIAAFPGSVITRGHYAKFLLEHKYVKSTREAFDRYIGDHAKCFVPREKVTPKQAVELILRAKGLPILAHPILYRMSYQRLETLVRHLKEAGLIGIEAIYSTYSNSEERQMRYLADTFNLCISGGSDFHGAAKPGLELATGYGTLSVPEEILQKLKEKVII